MTCFGMSLTLAKAKCSSELDASNFHFASACDVYNTLVISKSMDLFIGDQNMPLKAEILSRAHHFITSPIQNLQQKCCKILNFFYN
jgi:hypothetical protein